MLTKGKGIRLDELARYLDGISKSRLDTLKSSRALGRTSFYTKDGEILSSKALDAYRESIEFYIDKKFGYTSTNSSSYAAQLYDDDTVVVPSGLVRWFNDFVGIQRINDDIKQKAKSGNRGVFLLSLILAVSSIIGLGSYSNFQNGSITFFDLLGQVLFATIIASVLFKLIVFLYWRKERKQYLIHNEHLVIDVLINKGKVAKDELKKETSLGEIFLSKAIRGLLAKGFVAREGDDRYELNPKIEVLIEHSFWLDLTKQRNDEVFETIKAMYSKDKSITPSQLQKRLKIRYADAHDMLTKLKSES